MKRSRCKGSFSVDLSTLEDAENGPALGPAGFQGAGLITSMSSSEKPLLSARRVRYGRHRRTISMYVDQAPTGD